MSVREVLPFIVEDGSGNSLATSYATVLEFDIYMDRIPDEFKPGYLVADEFRKQQNLIRGTQLFDIYVYFPSVDAYGYQRLTRTQVLQFPRVGLVGPDGYFLNERSIPPFVKDAVCQLAYELDQTNLTVEPTRGVVSASVGPLSVTFDQNYSHAPRVISRFLRAMVAPYGGEIRGTSGLRSIPLFRS